MKLMKRYETFFLLLLFIIPQNNLNLHVFRGQMKKNRKNEARNCERYKRA